MSSGGNMVLPDRNLRRFWFKFQNTTLLPNEVLLGCGVTAATEAEAALIIQREVFSDQPLPNYTVQPDVDISTLDQRHVVPNMLAPIWEGIWFPGGFQKNFDPEDA